MTPVLIVVIVAVFGTVALATGVLVSAVMSRNAPERRRLEQAGQGSAISVLLENPSLTAEDSQLAKRLSAIVPRSPKDMSRLRKRFVRAGYNGLAPIGVYTVAQIALPIFFGVLPLFFMSLRDGWLLVAIGALFGYLIPSFTLDSLVRRRQKVIQNGLPDALDLMIVCLEAGSSMDQSILKVSEELDLAYPALCDEFRNIITETRAGKPRIEAFRNFADRTGVDDVRALVAMLVQTDRFGTSVSQALRTHAETSRTKRRQRAEERAAKIGVKLVFPLVFCLFPAFFVVTLGPAVIQFIRVLFGEVMGG